MLNTLLVERYNRDAIPVSVLILTIIGAVLASRKIRGGSGFHLAIGVIISVLYILFSRFSIVFATKEILPRCWQHGRPISSLAYWHFTCINAQAPK